MFLLSLKKLNQPVTTKSLVLIILLIYFCWLFINYSGNYHGLYLHIWKFTSGTFTFENDIFLQRSNHPKLSILYSLFNFFNINLDNDYIGFVLHILFSSLAGFFLFKIIKEYTQVNDVNSVLIILFTLLVVGKLLIESSVGSWLISDTGKPTYFAHLLIFVFVWLLLKQSSFLLFLISSLMLLISLRTTWFPIIIGVMYSLIFIKPLKKNLWVIGPLAILIYFLNLSNVGLNHDTKYLLFQNVIERDAEEVAFHLQGKIHLIFLILSFPIYYLLNSKIKKSNFKNLSTAVFVLSILCFLFGYLYALYGDQIWPNPAILLLSPTRSLNLYQIFFWILVCIWINKLNIFSIIKISIYAAIFYSLLVPTVSLKPFNGLLFGSFLIASSFLITKFYNKYNFLNLKSLVLNKSKQLNLFSTLIFFILLLPSILYLFIINLSFVDFYALKKINKWTTRPYLSNDKIRLENAILLQKCDDFILLDLQYPSVWTSAIAGKSQFEGQVSHNYFDIEIMKTSNLRHNLRNKIIKLILQQKKVPVKYVNQLYMIGTVVITNSIDKKFFADNVTSINLNNKDIILLFLKNSEKNKFLNNCKPNLNL